MVPLWRKPAGFYLGVCDFKGCSSTGEVEKMNGFFKQQWHLIKAVIKGRSESLSLPSACSNSIQEFCATFG